MRAQLRVTPAVHPEGSSRRESTETPASPLEAHNADAAAAVLCVLVVRTNADKPDQRKAPQSAHPSPNAVKHRRRTLAFSADKDKAALARRRAPTVCIAAAPFKPMR